jgi:hypothetical protein
MAKAIDTASDTSGQVDASEPVDTEDTNLDDITWEDGDVVEETTEETESDSAATDDDTTTEEESDDTGEDDDTDSDTEEASEDSTDKETTDAEDDTKAQEAAEQQRLNNEAAQRRIAEKQQREEARARATQEALDQSYTDAFDQAINAGYDEAQARIQAAQALTLQQLQVDAYNNRVMQVTNRVTADLNTAVSQIPEFKSDNKDVRDYMLRAVDNFEAAYVKKDANGDAVEVTGDIMQYLQNEADYARRLTGLGAQQQKQAKDTQKKRTLSPPSRTPAKPKVDPDLAAFDEEYARWS